MKVLLKISVMLARYISHKLTTILVHIYTYTSESLFALIIYRYIIANKPTDAKPYYICLPCHYKSAVHLFSSKFAFGKHECISLQTQNITGKAVHLNKLCLRDGRVCLKQKRENVLTPSALTLQVFYTYRRQYSIIFMRNTLIEI